jgi:hypothetical protein
MVYDEIYTLEQDLPENSQSPQIYTIVLKKYRAR